MTADLVVLVGGAALGVFNVGLLGGIYLRLGRALAILETHDARLSKLEERWT